MLVVKVKRIYDRPEVTDGLRILVDRLWPRGVRHGTANVDVWIKDIGPTDELRKWYAHELRKWPGFKKRYISELKENPEFEELVNVALENGTITLLYASYDTKHNGAVILYGVLMKALRKAEKKMAAANLKATNT